MPGGIKHSSIPTCLAFILLFSLTILLKLHSAVISSASKESNWTLNDHNVSPLISTQAVQGPTTHNTTNKSPGNHGPVEHQGRPPRAFLHIGPHKTATTSIQCALYQYREKLRMNDSTIFLGKIDSKFCKIKHPVGLDLRVGQLDKCLLQDETCRESITSDWGSYKNQGYDAVLSRELLSDWASPHHSNATFRAKFWPAMAELLAGWNVTVVVSYRRYFEWLLSAFNQHAFHMRVQMREPWPSYDEPFDTFGLALEKILSFQRYPPYPYVDTLVHDFEDLPQGWNIQLQNAPGAKDMVRPFLCDVLGARQTCESYETFQPKRESPAEDVAYDALNVEAVRRGWSSGRTKRGALARATRSFVSRTLGLSVSAFPVECPNHDILEQFLSRSLALEKDILGFSDNAEHTASFWNYTKRFCSVNASAVLQTNSTLWRDYYKET